MTELPVATPDRRAFLGKGLALAGGIVLGGGIASPAGAGMLPPLPAPRFVAPRFTSPRVIRPELLRAALKALQTHDGLGVRRDRMAIADFAAPSSQPRFHLVDLASGASTSFLVAHGSGSDPAHTGWVNRFSNAFNSNASSQGAFMTDDYYVGKHGRSQRLIGLDPTNNNALGRNIVVHSAWYANADMIATRGMLGRSQGCFAVGERQLSEVFERLGQGRMIYAAKV